MIKNGTIILISDKILLINYICTVRHVVDVIILLEQKIKENLNGIDEPPLKRLSERPSSMALINGLIS